MHAVVHLSCTRGIATLKNGAHLQTTLPFTNRNLTFEQATRLASIAEQGAVAGALLADKLVGGGAAGAAGRGRVVGQLAELVLRRIVLVLVVREVLHKCRARACRAQTLTHTTSRYSIAFTASSALPSSKHTWWNKCNSPLQPTYCFEPVPRNIRALWQKQLCTLARIYISNPRPLLTLQQPISLSI